MLSCITLGQGGLYHNSKRRYTARAIGGSVAEDIFERGLCLPSGTAMTKSDLDRVIDTILNCHRRLLGECKQGDEWMTA